MQRKTAQAWGSKRRRNVAERSPVIEDSEAIYVRPLPYPQQPLEGQEAVFFFFFLMTLYKEAQHKSTYVQQFLEGLPLPGSLPSNYSQPITNILKVKRMV